MHIKSLLKSEWLKRKRHEDRAVRDKLLVRRQPYPRYNHEKAFKNMGLFARLPLEIRQQIYFCALGKRNLYIAKNRLKGCIGHHEDLAHATFHFDHVLPSSKLSFLRTCRQIYFEASSILYTTNTFKVIGLDDRSAFLTFSQTIPQERLSSIRSVYIGCLSSQFYFWRQWKEWEPVWEVIATKMRGLQDLSIEIMMVSPRAILDLGEDWEKPLLNIRGLRNFSLDLTGFAPHDSENKKMVDRLERQLRASLCAPRSE